MANYDQIADTIAAAVTAMSGGGPRPTLPAPETARYRCCADRPPIRDDLWLRHGRIVDTDNTVYSANGHPLPKRWHL